MSMRTLLNVTNFLDHVLSECGEFLDIIIQGGDLAGQETKLMSLDDYREFVKPRQKKQSN